MNTSIIIALVTVALLFVCVFAGVHISLPDNLSFVGLFLVTSNLSTALGVLSPPFNAIRTYTYCVIPLFVWAPHGSLWFGWRLV
ncbi:MAG: hypothetical protein ACLRJV_17045 [Eubacteriales bacterium]